MEEEQKEQKQQTAANTLCEECREKASKYKCPGCSVRTCGLACVKAHKQRTSCSGKPNRTQFVPISQFDDNRLLSDYNLLEQIKTVADSARRTRNQLRAYPNLRLPYHLQHLKKAAAKRSTKLLLLPSGMSKREKNQSRFNLRRNFIAWTVEWRFHLTDVVLQDHGVHEDTILCSVLEKHLKPGPWNHALRAFCEEQPTSLKCFIRKYPQGPKSPFRQLDMKAPLRQQLANLVILEHPVIHVFLPSHSCNFEVVKDVVLVSGKQDTKNSINKPCPRGVAFREEEIEDNNLSDPQVFDFINSETFAPHHKTPDLKSPEKQLIDSSDGPSIMLEACNSSHFNSMDMEGVLENSEFDFDQGLIDAYSDLIAEVNTDDFFDFGGEFLTETESAERKELVDSKRSFGKEDEVEEGEILEYF